MAAKGLSTIKRSADSGSDLLGTLDDFPEINQKPKDTDTRFKSADKAHGLYLSLLRADESSSVQRSRVDAMYDGVPPYDAKVLKSTGQGSRTNLNFGEAQRYLDIAMSAFIDLYSSLENLVSVQLGPGVPDQLRTEAEAVIAEELTAMLRRNPEFHSNYQRLCTEFIKHGVGFCYFESPNKWNFRVGGFYDFVLPRQTPASEEQVEVAYGRREYMLHELYEFIKNPEKAERMGWDVEETRRVILRNAKTSVRGRENGGPTPSWEAFQRELKNNDVITGVANTTVSVVHFWGREHHGKISHFIFAEDDPKNWMFKKLNKFQTAEEAFIFFTYGVGNNGTIHSVRGQGTRIFPHVQMLNRLRCNTADGAMLASGVMIQPDSERALQNLSFTFFGPFSVLSPNVNVVEKAIPNLTNTARPVIQDMEQQLAANVDLTTTYGPQKGSPYRNVLQVEHELAVKSSLSGATLNLFHMSWNRLMREVVRRVVSGSDKSGEVKAFYQRCAERGVMPDVVEQVMPDRTFALRAIGNGSHANRLVALRELNGISGSFDEVGRRNLIRDIVATRVGHDLADRYAPVNPEPRLAVDAKVSILENDQLQRGENVPVLDNELHGMHLLQGHVPVFSELLATVQEGTADPVQALPAMQAFYNHVTEHLKLFSLDPAAQGDVAQIKQLMQVAEEWIVNTGRKVQKMQREAAQQQSEGQPIDQSKQAALQMRVEEHQLKMDIARQKAELDMSIRQAKHQQELAMSDARNAVDMGLGG